MAFSVGALALLEDFATNMEIRALVASDDGSFCFEFQRAGRLCFTPSAEGGAILMSLKRHPAALQFDDLRRFLLLSRWDARLEVSLNAGMSADGGLVLVTRIEEDQMNLPLLERCLDRLIVLHDEFGS